MKFDVYVPRDPAALLAIDPGSGIVATPTNTDQVPGRVSDPSPGRVLVDFEGNRFGSTNMITFADRVHHAAGRQKTGYPTVARAALEADRLQLVGQFDDETGEVTLDEGLLPEGQVRALVAAWCGVADDALDAELLTAGTARHLMRREILAARASGNPARKFAADEMARRHNIDV